MIAFLITIAVGNAVAASMLVLGAAPAAATDPVIVAAYASMLASISAAFLGWSNHRKLRTENGLSVGQLADRNEAERIMRNIVPENRTAAEQAYVEAYLRQGRNIGHEGQAQGPVRPDPALSPKPAAAPEADALPLASDVPSPPPVTGVPEPPRSIP